MVYGHPSHKIGILKQWVSKSVPQWLDDHPRLWKTKPCFDGVRRERGRSTNAPSRLRGVRGAEG